MDNSNMYPCKEFSTVPAIKKLVLRKSFNFIVNFSVIFPYLILKSFTGRCLLNTSSSYDNLEICEYIMIKTDRGGTYPKGIQNCCKKHRYTLKNVLKRRKEGGTYLVTGSRYCWRV